MPLGDGGHLKQGMEIVIVIEIAATMFIVLLS